MQKVKAMSTHNHFDDLPTRRDARWVLRVMVLALVSLLAWAAVSNIDQVTRAQAQIIPSDRTQVVQAPEMGVIRQLHVKEGDLVKAGQVLVTFEKERAQAGVNDGKAKVAALNITLARLRAEVYGTPLRFEPEFEVYGEYIRNQKALYHKRKTAIDEDLAAIENILTLARRELRVNRELEESGDVSKTEILRLQRSVAELHAQFTNKRNKYFQDAHAEMTKAQEDLSTQTEQLRDRSQLLQQTELASPADGVVKSIKLTTAGAVVRSGDVVLEILPTNGGLIAEAKISPADIAFIRIGQPASVKLDAYDYSIFGAMGGEVSYISADTLSEETRQGPTFYYRVQVLIREAEFKDKSGSRIQIRPGMTASVDIKAAERTVLSYLTKPVTKTFAESLGER
jgi:adhesin transport system membrane fusion protein